MSHPHGREPLPPSWVERHVGLIVKITVAVCVLLLVADVVFHFVGHKHVHFAIEAWPAFYAVVGFISYVGLVLTAKQLRKLVMRPLDFYGEAVPDPEPPSPELQPQQEEALARGLELEGEPQEDPERDEEDLEGDEGDEDAEGADEPEGAPSDDDESGDGEEAVR
ncbi:MAG: hypothetical protein CMN30_32615 [Sandaracinus sp.]|nr:hypothetical protein [Sandaracinus sp.]|tara:strand:+ start:2905 stop:3399 length:495 start_codon:yes stop_codon:yes gene_type:complete